MTRKEPFDETAIVRAPRAPLARTGDLRPEHNPALLYLHQLASKSAASARTMRSALDKAARIFDAIDQGIAPEQSTANVDTYPWASPGALTSAKVEATVSRVASERNAQGRQKRAWARTVAAALRQVARRAFKNRQIDVTERMNIDDVDAPALSGKVRGRRLTNAEIARLYRVCARDESPAGRRDAAILAIALGGGARRFEIAALDVDDYTRPSRLGRDPVELKVREGKGGKDAAIVAPPDVAEAIESWLDVRGREPGALFTRSAGRGRPLQKGSRLSAAGVYDVLLRRAEVAQIAPAIAPHDLRRTAITVFLERTGDLALAKTFARHVSPATTAKYDLREHDALRRAVAGARTGYVGE